MSTPCEQSEKIDEIYNAIVGTLTSPGIRAMIAEMTDTVSKLEHVVWGNGKPGLVETVGSLVEDRRRKKENKGEWILIISLLITNAVALLVPFLGKHP